MDRSFLQKQNQSISTTPNMQKFQSSLLTIPSYSPVFVENSNKKSPIGLQIKQEKTQWQNQQDQKSSSTNQFNFLQNVPLAKSLPQNFASTQYQIASQQLQKINLFLEPQSNLSNKQYNNQQQLNSSLQRSNTFQQPINNTLFTSAIEKTDAGNLILKQYNNEDHKNIQLKNSLSYKDLKIRDSTQMNSPITSEYIPQVQTSRYSYEQKTPKKINQNLDEFQSMINKYSLSAQNTERYFEGNKRFNTVHRDPSKDQQNILNQSFNNSISKSQKQILPQFSIETLPFFPDNNKINQYNQSCIQLNGVKGLQNTPLNQILNSNSQNIKTQDDYYVPDKYLSFEQIDNYKNYTNKIELSLDSYNNSPSQRIINQTPIQSNKSQKLNSFKLPLELIHNGNNIVDSNDNKINNNFNYHLKPLQNKLYVNEQNKSQSYFLDDSKDYTTMLEEEVQKLNQENQKLKTQLADQQNEYKTLQLKYQDIEKKYLTLQNQNSQAYSSCNSSVVFLKEDKNQNYLHDLVNTQSFSKIGSTNINSNNRRQSNNYSYIKRKNSAFKKYEPLSKTSIPLFNDYQTQNSLKVFDTFNNGILENINNMYKTLNTDTQFYTSNRIQPSLPSLILEEDYNYKKNNHNKIDSLIQKDSIKAFTPIKSFDKKLNSDIKQLSTSYSSILEEPHSEKQIHNPLYTPKQLSTLNQSSQKSIIDQNSFYYNSIYIPEYKSKLTTDIVKNTLNKVDEILRKSHEDSPIQSSKNIYSNRSNTIQFSPK